MGSRCESIKRGFVAVVFAAMVIGGAGVSQLSNVAWADEGDESGEAEEVARDGLGLKPAALRVSFDPGQVYNDNVTVKNESGEEVKVSIYARPYQVSNENYESDFSTTSNRTKITEWITFEKSEYTLAANQEQEMPYKISVPDDAEVGGQYAVIFVETMVGELPEEEEGQSIAVTKRPGMLIYATVKGDLNIAGSMESQKIDGLLFNPPLTSAVAVKNDGNTDFIVRNSLEVQSFFGGKNNNQDPPKAFEVLPETTRLMTMEWPDTPSMGLFRVTSTVEIQDLDFYSSVTKLVLVIPMPLFVIGAIALVLLIVMLVSHIQKKRAQKNDKQADTKDANDTKGEKSSDKSGKDSEKSKSDKS